MRKNTPGKKRGLILGIVLALFGIAMERAFYPYNQPMASGAFDRGTNGVWLRHDWFLGHPSDVEVQTLVKRLRAHGMRYAYFHLRSVDHTGKLRYPLGKSARYLAQTLHQSAPGIQVIAWVFAGNSRVGGRVNLEDPNVRKQMSSEAHRLAAVNGFDGIQWDYEISPNNDASFLQLLVETRNAIGKEKLLSVATPLWLPAPFHHWGWSDAYFSKVAARCDQIAVMAYDSGIWLPRVYVSIVKAQVIHVTRAVAGANPRCRTLIGLPTYEGGGLSHDPRVENLLLSLRGVREGLSDPRADSSAFEGIALFADYTTDDTEWRTYDRLWLNYTAH